jgi:hypothetical protein
VQGKVAKQVTSSSTELGMCVLCMSQQLSAVADEACN